MKPRAILAAIIFLVTAKILAQPVITQQPTNQTIIVGGSASFSIAVSGAGPFTYQWQFNGTNLPGNIITTVAGIGTNGYFGDGGAATGAELLSPEGVAVDGSGNLFIADEGNSRIQKVSANGIITTVAGNQYGDFGYFGDGGAATSARLYYPSGVGVDASGNLFIADSGNSRIRKVSANGIITTVAGNGDFGYFGDGGAATSAELFHPQGVAVDGSGNLFIADSGNERIRKVSTNGLITTVAGNGTKGYSGDGAAATGAELYYPWAVAVDGSGNLFIADSGNERIRTVSTNGMIATVAGNGNYGYSGDGAAATGAELAYPTGVAVDGSGNLFIADSGNNRIRTVSTIGMITTVVGNGTNGYFGSGGAPTDAELSYPYGVAVDGSDNLFIADSGNDRIRKVPLSDLAALSLASISQSNAGNYSVIITDIGGSVTSSVVSLTVIVPPTITSQPSSLTNYAGSCAYFTVAASGTSPAFQWFKNASPISGAVSDILTLPNVQDADAAAYTVVITNLAGSVTSSPPETLTVIDLPFVATQPQSQIVTVGSSVTFNAMAYGAPAFVFQWYFNNSPIGSPTSGTNVSSFTLTNVQTDQSGNYSLQVFNGYGSLMSSNATLTVIAPQTATGTAILTNGFVVGVNITDGGTGYTNTPLIRFIGGGGSGADGFASVSNGVVITITVSDAGYGYTNAPLVVIDPPFIPNPVLSIAPMSFLSFSSLTIGGAYQLQQLLAWYWTNQPLIFTASNSLYTQMFDGVVGSGEYRLALNPVPTQAFAIPEVVSGFVVGAPLTSGGSGYVTNPAVLIVGGGGTNATASSEISGGMVTNIVITDAGFGYTNTPTIRIGQPPAAAVSPTVLPVMRVDSANLAPYDNYQIQFNPDINGTWEDWNGGLFCPTDVTNAQFIFITNDVGFFRLQFVP